MPDYSDLGRMTATAIIDGHLDADDLADRPRALALVSPRPVAPHHNTDTDR